MPTPFKDIQTLHELHRFYRIAAPLHPLISVIDLTTVAPDRPDHEVSYRTSFYTVMCKRFEGQMKYGRTVYDFEAGTLMFTAPHQVITSGPDMQVTEGWGLFFHPDLLHGTELGRRIHDYACFHYDAAEALHVSEEEQQLLRRCLDQIVREYSGNMDPHTNGLITDNLQLLLHYCTRFYDRQFLSREKLSHDVVQRFEQLLLACFAGESLVDAGVPDVKYFATRLHLSPGYLSDLLSRYTGKSTQEHIHLQLIDKARTLLLGTGKPISEIAYELGFAHPSHFTKLFRSKTGVSPRAFRNLSSGS